MTITRAQAEQLAELATAARPHGARRWDIPGIIAAIGRVQQLALADVAMATMRAAADRTIDTPAVIANTRSSAWRERLAETAPVEKWTGPVCDVCSLPKPDCERRPHSGHAFATRTDHDRRLPPDQIADVVAELADRARQ